MIVFLNQEERNKFADYLEQEAATGRGIIRQMTKLSNDFVVEIMIKKEQREINAALMVAKKLRSIEDITIKGG